MSKTIEILSPAGSPESLIAAVRAGADAVYLGGSLFSARASAKNFSDEALKAAVEYCHARGVKVYLAINTILRQEELLPALSFLQFACSLPVDAVLVQDTGFLWLAQKCAPGMPLHASTQMSIHTPAGCKALAEAGLERVVLAREMSLEEIREAHAAAPVELEAFVHGALCMSVSGQCYFSAMLGSRSGNRGMCAQPCRLPFTAESGAFPAGPWRGCRGDLDSVRSAGAEGSFSGTGHDLSLKDLSMISRLSELAGAGVASAKIEGRMKRPEYVAAATRACRLSADGEPVPPELLKNLGAVFSRSGFTTGYLDQKLGREMFGVRSKEDVTSATNAVFSELRTLYQKELPRIPVTFSLTIRNGEPVSLEAQDPEGRRVSISHGDIPEPARNRPIDAARCEEQLQKTGGTPFAANAVRCTIEDGLSVPISLLNQYRREALEELERLRAKRAPVPFSLCEIPAPGTHRAKAMRLRARFPHTDLPEEAKRCELVYLPYFTPPETLQKLKSEGFPVALELPRGLFSLEPALKKALAAAKGAGVLDVWAGNLGAAALAKEAGMTVHGGFSLNITNSAASAWYHEFGLADSELSFELTLPQAAAVGGDMPRGLVVYGRLPLMLTRNCPAANSPRGCLHCKTPPVLTDRKGISFPVQCYGSCSEVLNSVPLYLADRMREVRGQDFGVLRFTTESREESAKILSAYFSALEDALSPSPEKPDASIFPQKGEFTRGLYYRGIE